MTRETMREMMADAPADAISPHLVANNTVEYERPDGTRVIRLHHTDIIEHRPDGSTVLNTGGWLTVTTKDRLNHFSPVQIYSNRGEWFVSAKGRERPFFDGMCIGPRLGIPTAPPSAYRETAKAIAGFIRKLPDPLPVPNAGDCWLCSMFNAKQKPGAACHDPSHLLDHVRENYWHGSLIVSAMRWAGYHDTGIRLHYQMKLRDTIKRVVRRYLRRQLGLAA